MTPIFLVWRCTHILSYSCGTTQRRGSSWCDTEHPILLLWHHSMPVIFVVWHSTSPHSPVALITNSHLPRVTLHIPSFQEAQLNDSHLPGVALHIPSSSCDTTTVNAANLPSVALHIKLILPWHCVTNPIILKWRCTSHHPPVAILNASHLPDAVLHIP
jgi:hypothetical protein